MQATTIWQEKLLDFAPGWRTTLPGLDSTEEIDNLVESEALGAIPRITQIATDEKEQDDLRYRAMRYLLVFHNEGNVTAEDLLHLLTGLARSRRDQEHYRPRRDAMRALTLLRGEIGRGSGRTDPRATEILSAIAADQQSPEYSRRDALEVLARPDTIRALAPDKVGSVLEVLLFAMTKPSSDKRIGQLVVQGIKAIPNPSWQGKVARLFEILKETPLARGDIDVAELVSAVTPLDVEPTKFVNQLSSMVIEAATKEQNGGMTGLLADLLIKTTGSDPIRAGDQINSYETAHKMPRGSLKALRIAVGGESALSEISDLTIGGAKVTKSQEKLIAVLFGAAFLIALFAVAIAFPQPTPFQYTIFRVILAVAAAGFVSMTPGFLEVNVGNGVRAGGAIAVFVVVYFFSPVALVANP